MSKDDGFEELERKFKALAKKADGAQVEAALMAAGEVIAEEMRQRVAVDDGGLKKSIIVARQERRTEKRVFIGPRWPEGAHAHLVEFGTVARTTRPARKKALAWAGGEHPVGMVRNGAMPARPFIRPAADAAKGRAYRVLADELEKVIRP